MHPMLLSSSSSSGSGSIIIIKSASFTKDYKVSYIKSYYFYFEMSVQRLHSLFDPNNAGGNVEN